MSRPPTEEVHAQDFPFQGQVVVFTGRLASVGHRGARKIVERLGGVVAEAVTTRTTMLVVGAGRVSAGTGDLVRKGGASSLKMKKAEKANAETPDRIRIIPEEKFCRLGGLTPAEELDRRYHSVRQIRDRYPLVREDHLRYLQKWSLVRPVVRTNTDCYYGFQDLRTIRQLSEGLTGGVSFRVVLRALVAAESGQQQFDFSQTVRGVPVGKVVALPSRLENDTTPKREVKFWPSSSDQLLLAAKYFREGSALDGGGEADQERACVAYRKALLLDPNLVPALVNLANIHYVLDELVEAQALYERALHLDGDCFEAYFNLGNIHHDLGRYLDALEHYRVAIGINPAYADAHFYLAVTLEKIGHSAEARAHWRSYRDLAPEGEWVELAKEFSEQ